MRILKKTLKYLTFLFFTGIIISRCYVHDCPNINEYIANDNKYTKEHLSDSNFVVNDYSIYVDFSRPSCQDRLWIVDGFRENILSYSGVVLHGCGGNSTPSKPEFSNEIGSKCSSLGVYRTDGFFKMSNGIEAIRLIGLSESNSNAEQRGIFIHPCLLATLLPFNLKNVNFPLTNACEGCFAVSYPTYYKIKKYVKEHPKTTLLFAYYGKALKP